jgi:hypothetical protein
LCEFATSTPYKAFVDIKTTPSTPFCLPCLPFPFCILPPFGVEIGTSSQREVTLGADKYIWAFVAEISYMTITRSTVEPMTDFPPLRTKLA